MSLDADLTPMKQSTHAQRARPQKADDKLTVDDLYAICSYLDCANSSESALKDPSIQRPGGEQSVIKDAELIKGIAYEMWCLIFEGSTPDEPFSWKNLPTQKTRSELVGDIGKIVQTIIDGNDVTRFTNDAFRGEPLAEQIAQDHDLESTPPELQTRVNRLTRQIGANLLRQLNVNQSIER